MNAQSTINLPSPRPPSRNDNPFATCWVRPGAIPFQFHRGQNAQDFVSDLGAKNWWGEIVGPHGSGKSTLLSTLAPLAASAGRDVSQIVLRNRQRRLPSGFLKRALSRDNPLVIIDGYEQLSSLSRIILIWQCRRAHAGLIVTSHASAGLPIIARLTPDRALVESLIAMLVDERPSPITTDDINASHARHGSNVRELFFDLHDRHERANRTNPNAQLAVSISSNGFDSIPAGDCSPAGD